MCTLDLWQHVGTGTRGGLVHTQKEIAFLVSHFGCPIPASMSVGIASLENSNSVVCLVAAAVAILGGENSGADFCVCRDSGTGLCCR